MNRWSLGTLIVTVATVLAVESLNADVLAVLAQGAATSQAIVPEAERLPATMSACSCPRCSQAMSPTPATSLSPVTSPRSPTVGGITSLGNIRL